MTRLLTHHRPFMFQKIAYNTSINFAAKIVATGLGLAAVAIMTRYLGAAGFGKYVTIIAYLQLFGLAADMGLTLVTSQLLAKGEHDEQTIIGNLLAYRLATAALFLLPAPVIALFLPYGTPIVTGIALATASFFAIALNQVFIGLYQKHLLMARASLAEIGNRAVLLGALLAAIYYNLGLQGVVIATVAASMAQLLINYWLSRGLVRVRLAFNRALWRQIFSVSWPIAVTISFNIIYLKADTLILSLLRPASEVGFYGAAYRVIDVIVMLPFVLAGLLLPQLTRAWHERGRKDFTQLLQHAFDTMAIIALPLMVGTQFVANRLMQLVAGPEFASSGPILRILILASGAIYLGTVFSHAIIAIDKQKQTIWAYIVVAITSLVGYLILIPRFSYVGAAIMTVYSEVAIGLLIFGITYYYTRFFPSLKVTFKSLLATAAMAGVLYATTWPLWASLMAAIAVYGAAMLILARRDLRRLVQA